MKCPECGAWTITLKTNKSPTFGYTRRRECGNLHRFTTKEVAIPAEELSQERKDNLLRNIGKRSKQV
jgi:transcriptional regulator NrdR family protein